MSLRYVTRGRYRDTAQRRKKADRLIIAQLQSKRKVPHLRAPLENSPYAEREGSHTVGAPTHSPSDATLA